MSLRKVVTTPELIEAVLRYGTRSATPDKKRELAPEDLVVIDVRITRPNAAPWLEVLVWSAAFAWHAYLGPQPEKDEPPVVGQATEQDWENAPVWRPAFYVTPKRKSDDD